QESEEGKSLTNASDVIRTINHPTELLSAPEETVVMEQKELNPDQEMVMQKEGAEGEKQVQNTTKAKPADLQNSLDQLIRLLSQGKASVKDIAAFEKIWNHRFQPQLMLQPEKVMEKEQVQEFYEKLSDQMQKLGNLVNEHGQTSSSLGKAVQNTVSNLDFMNQINQMHAYIQLPLKLSGQQAKGELYVFTNRRSLAEKEGKVTALLHLDMEYLGKLDVYVALENQKVSTQFYLEKEEYLDFLEQHMDLLSTRLNKRGYECSIKTCLRKEEEQSVMERIINHQSQPFLLSTQAFDMRV
ncbi:MAG: flagellar hook-length control protein FliK, partial [Lachnospiraceae bacterium]